MNEVNRRLKLVKTTEADGITKKVAHPDQNFSYDDLIGEIFVETFEIEQGLSMVLIPTIQKNEGSLRTSKVVDIDYVDELLVVKTKNTVYFFEVIA